MPFSTVISPVWAPFSPAYPASPKGLRYFSHRASKEGESLWDYANRWGLPIEALVESNPHIPNINELEAGEKVVVT